MYKLLLVVVASILLSACSTSDVVSLRLSPSGNDLAFSFSRERNFIWEDWTPYLVITHLPDCQRRYALKPVSADITLKVDVYQAAEGGYILRQGKRWYVAEVGKCQFQQFKEPPPEPGTLLGAFIEKDNGLEFKAAPADPAAAASPAGK